MAPTNGAPHDYKNDRALLAGHLQPINTTMNRINDNNTSINDYDTQLTLDKPRTPYEIQLYNEQGPRKYYQQAYARHLQTLRTEQYSIAEAKEFMITNQESDIARNNLPGDPDDRIPIQPYVNNGQCIYPLFINVLLRRSPNH